MHASEQLWKRSLFIFQRLDYWSLWNIFRKDKKKKMHSRLPICRHTKCETQKGARQLKLNYLPYWGKVNWDFQQLQRKRWWFLGNENGVKELTTVHFDSAWLLGWCPLHSSCEWRSKHLAILRTRNLHRQPLLVHLRGKMGQVSGCGIRSLGPPGELTEHIQHSTFWEALGDEVGLWMPLGYEIRGELPGTSWCRDKDTEGKPQLLSGKRYWF